MRRDVRRISIVLAALAVAWTIAVLVSGGFEVAVFGLRIRSTTAWRPVLAGLVAFVSFLSAGGRIGPGELRQGIRVIETFVNRRAAWTAGLVAIVTVVLAISFSTRSAIASDAYGYVSQADLWLSGNLKQQKPWAGDVPWREKVATFSPLGHRPAPGGELAVVPTYSPGLPMLFAIAKAVGGQCALFLVVPLLGGLAVFTTYLLGSRIGAPHAGLLAALLVFLSPAFLGVVVEPLSDVPTMAVWSLAFWCLLGQGRRASIGSGLLVSLAVLIRPNLVVLAVPMATWLLLTGGASGGRVSRASIIRAAIFSFAALPGILAIEWLNTYLYGSPLSSGYGTPGDLFALDRIGTNVSRYFRWFVESQSPAGLLGMAALALPLRALWPTVADRRVFVLVGVEVLLLWLLYMSYFVFDDWGYLRFLLPSWPFLMLGLASVALALARWLPKRAANVTVAIVIVGLGFWQVSFARRAGVFDYYRIEQHDARIGPIVRAHTEENSVVLTIERSGSVRYYAGRETLRYDYLDADTLDRDIAWLAARGVRAYALLDEREFEEFKRKFAGQRAVRALDWPTLVYEPRHIQLFDFGAPIDSAPNPVVVRAQSDPPIGCVPPQPLPEIRWR